MPNCLYVADIGFQASANLIAELVSPRLSQAANTVARLLARPCESSLNCCRIIRDA
jgi:hypothetical protein